MDPKIIYVESEDDITDVIGKLKQTGAKHIQLTPVRGSIALKSLINLRILLRTAKQTGQKITIATSDPTIRRLATTANIETVSASGIREEAPEEPETETPEVKKTETTEEVIEETTEPSKKSVKKITRKTEEQEEEVIVSSDLDDEDSEEGEKDKKSKKVPSFDKYRKWIIVGAVALVVLIGFIVWAVVFAPRVDITAYIKTTKKSLSDYYTSNITFTDKETDEDVGDGKFLLETHVTTDTASIEFDATGEKNVGNNATGTITVSRTGTYSTNALSIAKGSTVTQDGRKYTVNEDLSLRGASGMNEAQACSSNPMEGFCFKDGVIAGTLKVTAVAQGASSNTSETSGWTIKTGTYVTAAAITGGTDKIIKVVLNSDVEKALGNLGNNSVTCDSNKLPTDWPENLIVIGDTKTVKAGTPTSSPAVDQEVKDGVKPKLTVENSCTLYGVEKAKVNKLIEEKVNASIASEAGRKIFSTGIDEAWVAKRTVDDSGKPQAAKLETNQIQIGPALTIEEIYDYAKGEQVGQVRNWLSSQNGVTGVTIDTSFFWVSKVPTDANKVTITLEPSEDS